MKIELEIPDTKIAGLLCCAFEGGSNYWCDVGGFHVDDIDELRSKQKETYFHWSQYAPLCKGGVVKILDKLDNKEYKLTRISLERGLKVMQTLSPFQFGNFMSGDDDADTGDVYLQCCLFGEIKYG